MPVFLFFKINRPLGSGLAFRMLWWGPCSSGSLAFHDTHSVPPAPLRLCGHQKEANEKPCTKAKQQDAEKQWIRKRRGQKLCCGRGTKCGLGPSGLWTDTGPKQRRLTATFPIVCRHRQSSNHSVLLFSGLNPTNRKQAAWATYQKDDICGLCASYFSCRYEQTPEKLSARGRVDFGLQVWGYSCPGGEGRRVSMSCLVT